MDIYKLFNESKTLSEVLKKMNISDNNKNWNKIKEMAIEVGFDINIYKERKKKYCLKCNKELKRGQIKFCSRSCSASYNNIGRIVSEDTKERIKIGVNKSKKEKIVNNEDFLSSLNVNDVKTIVKLKQDGKTYKEIFNIVNLSYDKISKVCRIYGINKTYAHFKCKDEVFIKKVKKSYNEIKNLKKVAKLHGTSFIKVKEIVKYQKKHSIRNLKNVSISVINHRINMKKTLVEYKGGKCEICGYNKSLSALCFHHNDPNEKEFTIGGRNYSKERMLKEVDKCILLCQNCHHETHENERGLV